MNMIKQLLNLFFICLILTTISACTSQDQSKEDLLDKIKTRGYIIAGVKYDARPFGFVDQDQQLKGFDIDLLKEITKRLIGDKNKIEFRQVTSATRIPELTSSNIDIVAATMTINDKRKMVIDFSDTYYIAGQTLLVPIDSSIESVNDLSNKTVLVVLGSTSEKNVREMVPDAKILGFRTYTEAFSALKAKRGDALTTDDTVIAGMLSEDPEHFKMLSERFTQEPYGMGFKKGEDTKSFQKQVNKILQEMKDDGTLEKIRKKLMEDFLVEKKN
ncbi:MAG: transporter substrate-binding domain-containing protein [Vampirovibrionia bacterium]